MQLMGMLAHLPLLHLLNISRQLPKPCTAAAYSQSASTTHVDTVVDVGDHGGA